MTETIDQAQDRNTPAPIPVILGVLVVVIGATIASGLLDGVLVSLIPRDMVPSLRQLVAGCAVLILVGWAFVAAFQEAYLAALWLTAPRLPGLLAGAWLLAYLAPPLQDGSAFPPTAKLGVGLFVATLTWLAIAVPFRRLGVASTSQAQLYGELVVRYNQLRARCEACNPGVDGPKPINSNTAHSEAARQLRLVQTMLGLPPDGMAGFVAPRLDEGGLAWATGAGYVMAWEALNRVDEALIDVEPQSAIIGEALHDMLRLSESSIVNADRLQDALRAAVRHFDLDADELYFYPQRRRREDRPTAPGGDQSQDSRNGTGLPGSDVSDADRAAKADVAAAAVAGSTATDVVDTEGAAPAGSTTAVGLLDRPPSIAMPSSNGVAAGAKETIEDAAARAVVREVRHAVNDYRDSRRAGLIRARNRLLRTILVTGIAADILLGLVIIENVQPSLLATAAAFFLVGGVVGLFNRLRLEGDTESASSPDFGLFDARLLHTLMISGLAGVGGVFVMSAAPTAAAILSNNTAPITPPDLAEVFNPSSNRIGLLVAAVFGLTPDLVIGKLRQQTDSLKQDLSKSEAAVAGSGK